MMISLIGERHTSIRHQAITSGSDWFSAPAPIFHQQSPRDN
uniref:Uncharacterized protein n=1 Tax=Erwinia amylovora ATCC BAA-2158 TaxID=889211 RepID=E5B969_ERWAM|nr:hypothetical protein predicted by Glimmer/Critica [Erwinia amylovora ATCC BAA-2158]